MGNVLSTENGPGDEDWRINHRYIEAKQELEDAKKELAAAEDKEREAEQILAEVNAEIMDESFNEQLVREEMAKVRKEMEEAENNLVGTYSLKTITQTNDTLLPSFSLQTGEAEYLKEILLDRWRERIYELREAGGNARHKLTQKMQMIERVADAIYIDAPPPPPPPPLSPPPQTRSRQSAKRETVHASMLVDSSPDKD